MDTGRIKKSNEYKIYYVQKKGEYDSIHFISTFNKTSILIRFFFFFFFFFFNLTSPVNLFSYPKATGHPTLLSFFSLLSPSEMKR